MKKYFLLLGLICLWISHTSLVQVPKTVGKHYKKAKKHYHKSRYTKAKAIFESLANLEEQHEQAPYCLFFYALSAYRCGEQQRAYQTLVKLTQKFSEWNKIDEVFYWLAQLRFEQKDYPTALEYLARMHTKENEVAIKQLKSHFLMQLDHAAVLELLERYPKDQVIAEILAEKIMHQSPVQQDHALLDFLVVTFGLDKQKYSPDIIMHAHIERTYHVAIMLPFCMDQVDPQKENTHQFIFELYQGMKTAVATLGKEGIGIALHAYDTRADETTTAALLQQKEMKSMDLIIGPLYATTIPLVANFAKKYRINMFNPLSVNAEVTKNNDFAFLCKASLETQAKAAAKFTQKNQHPLRIGIVYGLENADSIKAYTYQQHIAQDTACQVALVLRMDPQASKEFFNTFKKSARTEEDLYQFDSLTHLYIASNDELIVANVLSAVEMLQNPDLHLIGNEAWLHFKVSAFDQLHRLKVALVARDYIDYIQPTVHAFREKFYQAFAQYPTYYSYTGFDALCFLGKMLGRYGADFPKYWGNRCYEGEIFSGFQYGLYHDNQYVPILKFTRQGLALCP